MSMPERSFGRTVRYRRTKLGLSQAQLGELVGRSTATIRAWERDKTRPNDPKVISALSAILGVTERQMFDKAEVDQPALAEQTDHTVEQALAELSAEDEDAPDDSDAPEAEPTGERELGPSDADAYPLEQDPEPVEDVDLERELAHVGASDSVATRLADASASAAYVAPPDRYVTTPPTPTVSDPSYLEDRSQRQLYRVRTLATLVALVALVVAFLWAIGESLGALGDWWEEFFGNLRL